MEEFLDAPYGVRGLYSVAWNGSALAASGQWNDLPPPWETMVDIVATSTDLKRADRPPHAAAVLAHVDHVGWEHVPGSRGRFGVALRVRDVLRRPGALGRAACIRM